MDHLGSPLWEQRDSREIIERTVSCSYVIFLFYQGGKVIILNFSFTYFLAVSSFLRIQTRPDQIGLDQTRPVSYKDSHYLFKVKSISFVFTNYILVHLQVSGICGDSQSFFMSYMKPY